jgi:hypothetical protein
MVRLSFSSPDNNYEDNTTSTLQSPILNTLFTHNLRLSFWTRYALETGWDYVFLDLSAMEAPPGAASQAWPH